MPLKDYAHFIMKKEFGYPYFNGYFAKIKFGLGDKNFIATQEEFKAFVETIRLPTLGIPNTAGRTLLANDQLKSVNRDQ
jgi:hypothetical protein